MLPASSPRMPHWCSAVCWNHQSSVDYPKRVVFWLDFGSRMPARKPRASWPILLLLACSAYTLQRPIPVSYVRRLSSDAVSQQTSTSDLSTAATGLSEMPTLWLNLHSMARPASCPLQPTHMARQKGNHKKSELLLAVFFTRLAFHAPKGRVLMRELVHCSSPNVTGMWSEVNKKLPSRSLLHATLASVQGFHSLSAFLQVRYPLGVLPR